MNYKNVKVDELEILLYFKSAEGEDVVLDLVDDFLELLKINAYAECNTEEMIEIRFVDLKYNEAGAAELVKVYEKAKTWFGRYSIKIGVQLEKFIDNYNLAEIDKDEFLNNISC